MSASPLDIPLPPCATDAPVALRRAYHDMCGEDDMPAAIEMGKHAYAHACEDSNCNVVEPGYDGSVCPEESGEHSRLRTIFLAASSNRRRGAQAPRLLLPTRPPRAALRPWPRRLWPRPWRRRSELRPSKPRDHVRVCDV